MVIINKKEMKKRFNKAVPSCFVGNGEQRSVSEGEIVALQELFDQQVEECGLRPLDIAARIQEKLKAMAEART